MARDIPFKPRFYIDHLQYVKHTGMMGPFSWSFWDTTIAPMDNIWCRAVDMNMLQNSDYANSTVGYESYQQEISSVKDIQNMFDFNPTNHGKIVLDYSQGVGSTTAPAPVWISAPTGLNYASQATKGEWYFGALGHNLKQAIGSLSCNWGTVTSQGNLTGHQGHTTDSYKDIINWSHEGDDATARTWHNGFSLQRLLDAPSLGTTTTNVSAVVFELASTQNMYDHYGHANATRAYIIGALTFGKIFDLSIPCDLKMNLSYEYGNKSVESRSGSYLSSSNWFQPPLWLGHPAWSLNDFPNNESAGQYEVDSTEYTDVENDTVANTPAYHDGAHYGFRKSGRRVYDMSFTFLDSDEMLPTYSGLWGGYGRANMYGGDSNESYTDANYLNDGTSSTMENTINNVGVNIINDHSFYAQVIHKTMGFHLPFIFQPNSDYCRPDGFMLARVDARRGFKLQQLAPDLWRCKLKVEEIW